MINDNQAKQQIESQLFEQVPEIKMLGAEISMSVIILLRKGLDAFQEYRDAREETLQKENAKLRECVEFYADDGNYTDVYTNKFGHVRALLLEIDAEKRVDERRLLFGKKARETLKELEGGK